MSFRSLTDLLQLFSLIPLPFPFVGIGRSPVQTSHEYLKAPLADFLYLESNMHPDQRWGGKKALIETQLHYLGGAHGKKEEEAAQSCLISQSLISVVSLCCSA